MRNKPRLSPAIRITVIYLTAGTFWILLSDRLLEMFISEPGQFNWLQTLKGWVFILVTAAFYILDYIDI